MRYSEWLEQYMANYVCPFLKMSTIDRYGNTIRLYLNPKLGDCELKDISISLLQDAVAKWIECGLSPNTVNGIITVMTKSLKIGQETGAVPQELSLTVKRPKVYEKSVSCFTREEQQLIESNVLRSTKPYRKGVLLCLYTGLRLGELLALRWDDIDLYKREIAVTKTVYYSKAEKGEFARIEGQPKTVSSKRIIPIPKQLIPILTEWKDISDSKYVISNRGKPMATRSYQEMFKRMLMRCGISHKGFHSLRHTFATRAIEEGMDVKTLSEILGHKNTSITLNRYVHSISEHKKEAMDMVGSLLHTHHCNIYTLIK